jgi:hypothetical protein
MTILIAYRRRGSVCWSHHFRVEPSQWTAFYSFARAHRNEAEYSYVRNGDYEPVLS